MTSYQCKYCFDTGTDYNEFVSPCKCKGTLMFVHKECLNSWFESNQSNEAYSKCSECHSKFIRKTEISNDIQHNTDITVLFYETITLFIGSVLFFSSQFQGEMLLLSILLIVFILSNFTFLHLYNSEISMFVILCYFGILMLPKSYTRFGVGLFILLMMVLCSYSIIEHGYIGIRNSLMKTMKEADKKIYDYYLQTFVNGII